MGIKGGKKVTKFKMTNMCMIEDDKGNVLVQERIKSWKGITFPGGKIELNESIYNSVIREIKEETNLDIKELKFCGVKDWYDPKEDLKYYVYLFKTNKYSGELLEDIEEGHNFWLKKEELTNSKLASGFEKDLELFYDDNKFEIHWIFDEEDGWIRNII